MNGPYKVIYTTLETLTTKQNIEEVTVWNDRLIQDSRKETKDPDQKDEADDKTDTSTAEDDDDEPTNIEDGCKKYAKQ